MINFIEKFIDFCNNNCFIEWSVSQWEVEIWNRWNFLKSTISNMFNDTDEVKFFIFDDTRPLDKSLFKWVYNWNSITNEYCILDIQDIIDNKYFARN
jgi:hypothetical protein